MAKKIKAPKGVQVVNTQVGCIHCNGTCTDLKKGSLWGFKEYTYCGITMTVRTYEKESK